MNHFFLFLFFLIVTRSSAEAERLSSGEDVKNFVERHIEGYEVVCLHFM